MQRERKLAALRRAFKDPDARASGAEISFFCHKPKPNGCGGEHHKRKLSVNIDDDVFHCWVCGYGGHSLEPLLRPLGEKDRDYQDYLAEHKPKEKQEKRHAVPKLPKEFLPLACPRPTPYYKQAIAYLANRGIGEEDILTYKLGYAEDGKYADRIIIPSFDEYGELNFFTARGIWERVQPVYLTEQFDKDIIFNDLLVDWSRPITLVEGAFDGIKAGTNAIPMLGKYMLPRLKDKIIARKPTVQVALDNDALQDALKLAEELAAYEVDVRLVIWPKSIKDPGDMTKEQFAEYAAKARRVSSPTDILRIRALHSASIS